MFTVFCAGFCCGLAVGILVLMAYLKQVRKTLKDVYDGVDGLQAFISQRGTRK